MRHALLLLAPALLVLPPKALAIADQPAEAQAGGDLFMGGLTEKEFQALHELKSESPGALRGTMIDVAGGRAYLSLPEGAAAPLPGVVVIHEWWGLNDHVKHWADRLAAEGHAALAVDLYGGHVATTPEEATAAMKQVDDAKALASLRAAHEFLRTDPRVRAPKTAAIGWCFGGHWALRTAMAEPELDAAVIYYGRLITDPAQLKTISGAVLGVFGSRDASIPPDQVDAFAAGLKQAGVRHRILRYDANHAFANPSGARYDEQSAEAAWKEASAFLREHLQAPGS